MKAYRFGRVSTQAQGIEAGAASIPDQDAITLAYVERKGWTDGGFRHDEATGTSMERPGWQATVAACEPGDAIVVHKADRFARSLLHGVTEIARLADLGIDIVIVDPELDTTTPFGRAFRSMLLVFAELDREMVLARMAGGQYGKARAGGWPSSRSGAPFGLRSEGAGREARLVLDEAEAATIRKAADLLVEERQSISQICATLNAQGMRPRRSRAWNNRLMRDMLGQPARKGEVWWGRPETNGTGRYGEPVLIPGVPAVLTPERWDLVQLALARDASGPAAARREAWPLSKVMTSPCGRYYVGRYRNDIGLSQYICIGSRWQDEPGWESCGCPRLNADQIESRVWAQVSALLGDGDRLREQAQAYLGLAGRKGESQADELAGLERSVTKLRGSLTRMIADGARAGLDPQALAAATAQLQEELTALEQRRASIARWLAEGTERQRQIDSLEVLAAQARTRLATTSLPQRAELLALLDIRVTVLDSSKAPALEVSGIVSEGMLRNRQEQGLRAG